MPLSRKLIESALAFAVSLAFAIASAQAEEAKGSDNASAATQSTDAKSLAWKMRDQAGAQLSEGHPLEAMATLKNALQLDPKNAWVRFDLSRLHHQMGDQKQGRTLIEEGLSVAPNDPDMLYASALYLGLLDEADNAMLLLDKIPEAARTPPMQKLRKQMSIKSQIKQAKSLDQQGRHADALVIMGRAESDAGDDTELVNDVSSAWLDIGEPSRGRLMLKRQLVKQSNPPIELRMRYAALLNRMERYDELYPVLDQLNSSKELSDKDREKVRSLQASLNARRAKGYVSTGVDYLSRTDGTDGISNFKALEIPIEIRMPVGYGGGQAFVQVDPVRADAGTLPLSDFNNLNQFGTTLASAPQSSTSNGAGITNTSQSARGTALAAGYEKNGMRADIGTTPMGFPVSNVVGGIKWSHYTETSGFSFDASRRPVTSSLLSYAGAHDPVSNEVWGGVRSSGLNLHVSRDKGRLNVFADLGYYWLTGKNVMNNTEAALRTGFDWSFVREDNQKVTAGLAFTDWHYRENLSHYSFGHGGYYSPQKYLSLALPIRWTGRKERWSYLLQGSVSASVSYEKDMPYYPTDATLQAQATVNAAATIPSTSSIYIGGNSHGTGHSFGGMLEYQFTPQLFGGARLQIDRSAYYTPNFATLYLRYTFDAHTGAVPFPPEPTKPYSQY